MKKTKQKDSSKSKEQVKAKVKTAKPQKTRVEKIDQQLNRLKLQKNRLKQKEKTGSKQTRRARTRTLIQVGGLVEKSGLLDLFDIQTGEDLQLDHDAFEKAAALFALLSKTHLNNENISKTERENLKALGVRKLKQKAYENWSEEK